MWTIYYANGSTFSDRDGTAFDAPRDGVEIIVTSDIRTNRIGLISHSDYYYYEPTVCDWQWWHCDLIGMSQHLKRAKQPLVLFGEYTSANNFSDIEKRALAEVNNKQHWWRGGPSSEPGMLRT